MKIPFYKLTIILAGLLLLQLACGLSITEKPQDTPTALPPTATEMAATDTPTPQPSSTLTALPPTATNLPPTLTATQPPTANLQGNRLLLNAGATSISTSGTIKAGSQIHYLAGASAGNHLMVSLDSADSSLALQITAPNGQVLLGAAQQTRYWQADLPLNGDYQISVVAASSDASFGLTLTFPVRITYAAGAVSSNTPGHISSHDTNTYLLRAMQGQSMSVAIDSPNKVVLLTIYGLTDGNPYIRHVSGASEFTFTLPLTQDYVIQCFNSNDTPVDYTLYTTVK